MFLTSDRDRHFIQMPFVGELLARGPNTLRYLRPEFSAPSPDGFIAQNDAAFSKEILDGTVALIV